MNTKEKYSYDKTKPKHKDDECCVPGCKSVIWIKRRCLCRSHYMKLYFKAKSRDDTTMDQVLEEIKAQSKTNPRQKGGQRRSTKKSRGRPQGWKMTREKEELWEFKTYSTTGSSRSARSRSRSKSKVAARRRRS